MEIPDPYPEGAWYTYGDQACDYSCMVTEYFYWSLTSLLGAQEIDQEKLGMNGGCIRPGCYVKATTLF